MWRCIRPWNRVTGRNSLFRLEAIARSACARSLATVGRAAGTTDARRAHPRADVLNPNVQVLQ